MKITIDIDQSMLDAINRRIALHDRVLFGDLPLSQVAGLLNSIDALLGQEVIEQYNSGDAI